MKRKEKIIIVLFVVLLLGALVYQSGFLKGRRATACTLIEVDTIAPILLEGKVEPLRTQEVYYNQTNGDIASVKVSTGDAVGKGQELIIYSNTDRSKALDEQQRLLERSRGNKVSAQKELDDAYYKYNQTEDKIECYKKDLKALKDEDIAAEKNISIEQNLSAEEAKLQNRLAVIDSLKEKIGVYEDQCEDYTAQIKQLEDGVSYTEKSNLDGTVVVNEAAIDNPMAAAPLITVYSNETGIIGEANEYDYPKLEKGRSVEIKPLSSNEIIMGTISKIHTVPENISGGGQGMSQYKFTVAPTKKIHLGFSVQISMPQNEIMLSKKAVKMIDEKYYVFKVIDNVASQVEVKLEEKTDGYFIQSGIEKGEYIIEDATNIHDGMTVSVKQ